jgi:hypothetical protein
VVNLHKYMILHGLKFSKSDHVFFIHVLYGLLTTKHVDTVTLDTFAKVSPAFDRCGKLVRTAAQDLKLQFTFPYAYIEDVQVTEEALSSQKRTFST